MSDPKFNNQTTGSSTTSNFTSEDIEKNKTIAGLAYIIFFLPLIICPESKFAKFHANQGLLLLILGFAGSIILCMIPFIGWILLPFFSIGIFVIAIIGLISGLGGKSNELPVIGKFRLLK